MNKYRLEIKYFLLFQEMNNNKIGPTLSVWQLGVISFTKSISISWKTNFLAN